MYKEAGSYGWGANPNLPLIERYKPSHFIQYCWLYMTVLNITVYILLGGFSNLLVSVFLPILAIYTESV